LNVYSVATELSVSKNPRNSEMEGRIRPNFSLLFNLGKAFEE